MDTDEPQEWYYLIRARLSAAQFPKYSWQGAAHYQNKIHWLNEAEYRRLNSWEYNAEEATQRQEAMEQYFREWPLSK